MDLYCTLPWVMWEAVTGVEGIPCWGLLRYMLANRALVCPSQRIVVKAAWLWGSDSRIINNPPGEPGSTPLYVCPLSMWSSVKGDRMFSPVLWEDSLTGDSDGYKWMNKPLALETEHLSLHRDPTGEHGVGLLYQGLWGKGEGFYESKYGGHLELW